MKIKLELNTDEKNYEIQATFDFEEKRPLEYVGVGYASVVFKAISIYLEKLRNQSAKVGRAIEVKIGFDQAQSEIDCNEMWPFDKKVIRDSLPPEKDDNQNPPRFST